jgi:lysophospholipase L1-like esterase
MQEIIQLEIALKQTAKPPDLVLLYDGFGDISAPYYTGRVDVPADFEQLGQKAAQDDRQPSWAFLKATNSYRLVQVLMDELLKLKKRASQTAADAPPAKELDHYAAMAADNYLKNIRLLQSLSEHYSFRYLVLWQPLIFLGNKPLDPYERKVLEAREHENPGISELCRKAYALVFSAADSHFVNLSDVFDHTSDEVFMDYGHTYPIGNRLIAERMLETIRECRGCPHDAVTAANCIECSVRPPAIPIRAPLSTNTPSPIASR